MSSIIYELLQNALAIALSAKGDTFRLLGDLYGIRTNVALDQSDPKKSLEFAMIWLEFEKTKFDETGQPTAELAAAQNSMGIAQATCGFFREAEVHLMISKSLRESLSGFKPSHNFSPLSALGICAWLEGRYSDAKGYLLQALRDHQAELGVDDRDSQRYV